MVRRSGLEEEEEAAEMAVDDNVIDCSWDGGPKDAAEVVGV